MPKAFTPHTKHPFSYTKLRRPLKRIVSHAPPLTSRGNKPLELSFEQQLNALILFHLEEHSSAQELLQFLEEDDVSRLIVGAPGGIKKSTFYEAINTRGLPQMIHVFTELYRVASKTLPKEYGKLGKLVAIDGSMIDATLTMEWADYRDGSKKAKAHVGFDLNRSIPSKIYLADGNSDEHPYVSVIFKRGQTGVIDRYYQCYRDFDAWQEQGKHFVCRIKAKSRKTVIRHNNLSSDSPVFYDAVVLLGIPDVNQTQREVRVIGYRVGSQSFWLATDRFDLTAEEIMTIYKLRWNIETFFGWWKQHLTVYHRIARSSYGMLVQLLAGLITYLLLAIYCRKEFNEKVSIKRVRHLRNTFRIESRHPDFNPSLLAFGRDSFIKQHQYAKT